MGDLNCRITGKTLAIAVAFFLGLASSASAFEAETVFAPWTKAISFETAFAHFGPRLNDSGYVQAWNLSGRFSLLPFGITRFKHLSGVLDGAVDISVGPTFERFNNQRQNFGGLAFGFRYYLLHFHYGRMVPWIGVSVAPGGSDLRIGTKEAENRLTGPFMALIQAGAGASYFFSDRTSLYVGLQAQHLSNASLNGSLRNFDLNTPLGIVIGIERFL